MSKETSLEKTMNVETFVGTQAYEPELCVVFKAKWSGLVLTEHDWERKVSDFLGKKVN